MGEVKDDLLKSIPYFLKMPSNRIWSELVERLVVKEFTRGENLGLKNKICIRIIICCKIIHYEK